MIFFITTLVLASSCLADVSHILKGHSPPASTEEPPLLEPPRPYDFQYQAGRFPGHVDRVHHEVSDGTGTIRGSYSFVDPKHKIRTVEYVADESGFHPSLINYEDTQTLPRDSEAVERAKDKHFQLYNKIADKNARGAVADLPKDTASVKNAKDRHFQLFHKISEEHAAIAAQREAELISDEATELSHSKH